MAFAANWLDATSEESRLRKRDVESLAEHADQGIHGLGALVKINAIYARRSERRLAVIFIVLMVAVMILFTVMAVRIGHGVN